MKSRRVLSAALSGALLLVVLVTPVFAYSGDVQEGSQESIDLYCARDETYTQDELIKIAETFSGWDENELNEYITYLSTIDSVQARASVPTGNGQAAWLAAAAIVEEKYPCVAALIYASVLGQDYIESVGSTADDVTGLFQTKIKSTSQYSSYVRQLQLDSAKNGKLMTFGDCPQYCVNLRSSVK